MFSLLLEKLKEVVGAVAPLVAVVCILLLLASAPLAIVLQFLAGSLLVVIGMVLLFAGLDIGVLPMGRFIGAELPKLGSITLVIAVGFAMGFATTVAEPDVLVLANQVDAASGGSIREHVVLYVIALGVAIFVGLAMARIIFGFSVRLMLAIAYGTVIALSFFTPVNFVALSYDAGSVTTGVLTAPVIIALAIGLSSVLAGRSAIADGFGLLGFASIGPIIAVMIMGIVLR